MKAVIEDYFNILKPEIIKAIEGQIAKYPNQENSISEWVDICKKELGEIEGISSYVAPSSFTRQDDRVFGETIEAIACMFHMLMDRYSTTVASRIVPNIRDRG